MKNERGREAGKCSKVIPDRGDRCLFIFFWTRSLLCNVFPFPVCKAQLIGDWYENRRGAPNTIIFLIIRQYYWRTDSPRANSNGGPNTKKNPRNRIGSPCLVRVAYWRRGTSVRQYIGAPIHPAPVVIGPCSITNGGPNISVRLTYFHSNRLLTGLYKQETEIRWRKDKGCIKK